MAATPVLAIRVAANLAELRKNLAEGVIQIETTRAALQKLSSSFQGERLIRHAQDVAAAVSKIGGASKLTEAEQARVNRVVEAALEKYRLLGKEAPPGLRQLAEATRQISTETKGATEQATSWRTQLTAVASAIGITFSIGAVIQFGRSLLALGDQIKRVADQTGMTTTEVQRLSYIAGQSGNSLDELTGVISRMQDKLASGDASAVGALRKLGVAFGELERAGPYQQLELIAAAVAKVPNPAERAALAIDLFGKSGAANLPTLLAGFRELGDQAPVMAANTVQALDRAGDSLSRLGLTVKVAAAEAYNWLGNLFDRFVAWAMRMNAASMDAFAKLIELTSKLPGMATAFDKAGLSAASLREGAQRLRETAAGLVTQTAAVTQETGKAAAGFRILTPEMRAAAEAAKKTATETESLRKQITGAALQAEVAKLTAVFAQLTPAQLANANVMKQVVAVAVDLRAKGAELTPALEAFVAANQRAIPSSRGLLSVVTMWADRMPDMSAQVHAATNVMQSFTKDGVIPSTAAIGKFVAGISALPEPIISGEAAITAAIQTTRTWGETMTDVLGSIPQLVASAFTGGGGLSGALKGVTSAFGAATVGKIFGDLTKGATGMLGALAPGIGAALGSLVGPLVSAIAGLFSKPEWKKVIADVGRDYGLTISENLAHAIEKDSLRVGDRVAATLLHLKDIIAEAGGVAAFGFERSIAKARDLFVQIETGKLSVREAGKAFDEVFGMLVPDAIDKTTGLVSASFRELLELDERFQTQSAAVAQFISGQVDQALTGLTALVTGAALTTQEAATGVAGAIQAIYDRLVAQGVPLTEVFQQLDPLIGQFEAQLAASGFVGGQAFDYIRTMATMARDEVSGPLIRSMLGAGQALAALNNIGGLSQETFAGLARQVSDNRDKLLAMGADGDMVLRMIAPSLQTIWALQQDFGLSVDEATQQMLDQGVAAGLVGNQHRDAQERAARAMEHVAEVMDRIADKLFGLGTAASSAAGQIEGAFGSLEINVPVGFDLAPIPNITIPEITIPARWQDFDLGPIAPGYATGTDGRFVDFGAGTLAMLHGREAIVPERAPMPAGGSSLARSVEASQNVTINLDLNITGVLDDGALVQTVQRKVAPILAKSIEDGVAGLRTRFREGLGVG